MTAVREHFWPGAAIGNLATIGQMLLEIRSEPRSEIDSASAPL
jgi:hypothetical protein